MNARELLKTKGVKYTKQREEILTILMDHTLPLSMGQIRDELSVRMDLSTIYRTMDMFFEHGLVTRTVPLEPSQTVYEFNRHIHKHHLICTRCGRIQVVKGCPLHEYEHSVEKSTGYLIDRHQLELYGVCPDCQALE